MLHHKHSPPSIDEFCLWVDYHTRQKLLETAVLAPGAEVGIFAYWDNIHDSALAVQACYKCPQLQHPPTMRMDAVCPMT